MIKYELAPDIQQIMNRVIDNTKLFHIKRERVVCIRSRGSESRGTIARCHALTRIWQKALGCRAAYLIEVISERYDKLSEEERIKTIIHELMHIPKAFGGGFKHHDFVNRKNIEAVYGRYKEYEGNNQATWHQGSNMQEHFF